MDYIYILATLNDGGVRRIATAAKTREELAAVADKVVTHFVKTGYTLADVLEADADADPEDPGLERRIYKAYYLKRAKTRKTPPDLVILELYEQPVTTPANFSADDLSISYR